METPLHPALFQVWQAEELDQPRPFRAQLYGWVGHFESQKTADRFVAAVKKHRKIN